MIESKIFKKRRLALALSKRKVAKLTNLDRQTITNAENGKNITIATFNALNNFYTSQEQSTDA